MSHLDSLVAFHSLFALIAHRHSAFCGRMLNTLLITVLLTAWTWAGYALKNDAQRLRELGCVSYANVCV